MRFLVLLLIFIKCCVVLHNELTENNSCSENCLPLLLYHSTLPQFLLGDLDQDHWLIQNQSDTYCTSKELINLWLHVEWIYWFLWCAMIWVILDKDLDHCSWSRSTQKSTPLQEKWKMLKPVKRWKIIISNQAQFRTGIRCLSPCVFSFPQLF